MDAHQSYQSLVYLSIEGRRRTSDLISPPMEGTSWPLVQIITMFVINIRLLHSSSLQQVFLCSVQVVEQVGQVEELHWLM